MQTEMRIEISVFPELVKWSLIFFPKRTHYISQQPRKYKFRKVLQREAPSRAVLDSEGLSCTLILSLHPMYLFFYEKRSTAGEKNILTDKSCNTNHGTAVPLKYTTAI